MENKMSAIAPTVSEPITVGLDQPSDPSPALLNPNTMPPNPIVDRIMESTSIFGFVMSDTFCM